MNQLSLKDVEFVQFRDWLYGATGINLTEAKKALLAGRLSKRLRHYELESYGEYFHLIMDKGATAELQIAIDLLTTNETFFFRENKHFKFLSEVILPNSPRGKQLRVWSAACSSGEEPYSIAMTLAEFLGCETRLGNAWEVLASDISSHVLTIAQNAHYPMERARNIPQEYLKKYCLKGVGDQAGTFLIDKTIRTRVRFFQINLNERLLDNGEFDVIFLRNVMIYFDAATKRKVVERLVPKLRVGGYFLVSHSESLHGINDDLSVVMPSIYRKTGSS